MKDFSTTIDYWIKELEQKTFAQICAKPSSKSWSLGQVGMHLIAATRHYLEEVNICLSNNDHADEEMSSNAKTMFRNDAFPDEFIEGPSTNAATPQPDCKENLLGSLVSLKKEMEDIRPLIVKSSFTGKTKHPGLLYFNAGEWYQFADMHFRHHLRQKKRIEAFLEDQIQ